MRRPKSLERIGPQEVEHGRLVVDAAPVAGALETAGLFEASGVARKRFRFRWRNEFSTSVDRSGCAAIDGVWDARRMIIPRNANRSHARMIDKPSGAKAPCRTHLPSNMRCHS